MAWESVIELKSNQTVKTPEGYGTVRRVSIPNQTAQVEVNGQLYEFPVEKLSDAGEGTPSTSTPDSGKPEYLTPDNIKEGDVVRKRDSGKTGTVSKVTQRTVYVEFDNNQGEAKPYKKSTINQTFERIKDAPEPKTEEEKLEEQRNNRTEDQKANDIASDLYGLLNLKDKLEKKIEDSVDGELKELRDQVKRNQVLEVKVNGKSNEVKGLKHKQLQQLINYCALRLSPLMVGMAGTGKTHAGTQAAEALGLKFYSISVGAQTTKTDIMGYMDATGRYIRTLFREAYENGGVFLMDEIDAGNANVLITINAALANGLAAFPDGMVKRHEDFVFIASANTFGNGANRQYVGRNQLDAATLDRFALLEWLIDDDLESNLTTGLNGTAWYMAVKASRDYVSEKNIRALISPRATQKGSKLLDIGCQLNEVIDATLLGSVPDDKKSEVREVATKIFETFASEVPGVLSQEVNPPTASDLLKGLEPEPEISF